MNILRNIIALCLLAGTSAASALTPYSIIYPAANTSGYIKVVVNPSANISAAADVLFVIDNSGSMNVFQQKLAANVPLMVNELTSFTGTMNVAMITTDADNANEAGRFQGTPAVLKLGMPDFVTNLSQRLMPGEMGSGFEKHLQAIKNSLSEPLLSTVNAGFLRPGVPLNVIIVSDEDDQSVIPTNDFVNFMKGIGDVSMFGIISTSACSMGLGPTPRLTDVFQAMNGEIHDICSQDDWGNKLRSIGKSINTQVTRSVRLPTEPVVRTIEVKYGSQILAAGDAQEGWVYNRHQMSIVIGENFNFNSQAAGTELEIKFVPKYWEN